MKKLLFDCERMKHPHTGLYHYCLNLGSALLKNKKPDEEVDYFLPKSLVGLFGTDQNYLIQKSLHKIFIPGSDRFDAWHMTHQLSSYRPFRSDTKVVLTIHDLNFLYTNPSKRRERNYLRLIQRNIDRADHIICISQYSLRDVQSRLNLANKPATVIYNGCTFHESNPLHVPLYKPSKPFLFSLGTVLPKKNFHVLTCLLQSRDVELVIAGTAQHPYKEQIISEAKRFGVLDRLKIIGAVSEDDKSWYYQHCTAFLLPSLAEGFGLPVIEAMHYGKPVFLSNRTSLPEIGGNYAYYFDDFSPELMKQVLSEGLEDYSRRKPANEIKKWSSRFSWETTAMEYWNVYRSAADLTRTGQTQLGRFSD